MPFSYWGLSGAGGGLVLELKSDLSGLVKRAVSNPSIPNGFSTAGNANC